MFGVKAQTRLPSLFRLGVNKKQLGPPEGEVGSRLGMRGGGGREETRSTNGVLPAVLAPKLSHHWSREPVPSPVPVCPPFSGHTLPCAALGLLARCQCGAGASYVTFWSSRL